MIIKKFQANTETEAIMLAKEELGKDAVVMNIKTISPKGIYRLFKKKTVEVTAAADEASDIPMTKSARNQHREAMLNNPDIIPDEEEKPLEAAAGKQGSLRGTSAIEEKLNNLASILEKQMGEKAGVQKETVHDEAKEADDNRNLSCMKLIFNQLVGNEMSEGNANQVISEVESTLKKDTPMESILSGVYQKIVLKLGKTSLIEVKDSKTKYVFFIGPTGVGKTTTIAKLASKLKLEKKVKLALLAADTYRIAAVEQLRTYTSIMQVPLRVIYSDNEMPDAIEELKDYDIVLVDTAGRSYRNVEQRNDIERLIKAVPEEQRDIYLVLSATTKYRDLVQICESYSQLFDYKLIFTKLDETNTVGNIYNLKILTNASLSYATFGQNVPDDIGRIDAQQIAKQLLGGQ